MSPDFGYGIMQVTSGMPGAFGKPTGDLDPNVASRIASEYRYNIAYGLRILGQKWASTPKIGTGDPTALEDWYFAIWAYNGWGWVNNPNNPRFSRQGTPATDPATYPYQERVLYLVSHPPRDADGNPLWQPVPVTLPSRKTIGSSPHSFAPRKLHRQSPAPLDAIYEPAPLDSSAPAGSQMVSVHLINTGTQPWLASGTQAVTLTYHLLSANGNPWGPLTPFSAGVLAFGQHPVSLPENILSGQRVTLPIEVDAPAAAGTYLVAWDLQVGAGSWFSQGGVLPRAERLHVIAVGGTRPSSQPTPTPTPAAAEDLRYVADTAAPDGSVVAGREQFVKGWLVFNNGEVAWGPSWSLVQVAGKSLGAHSISVPATRACHAANIIATLRAPKNSGSYTASWRLRDAAGQLVGQRLTVVVQVRGSQPPPHATPTPVASPTPTRTPGPTPTPTPVG